jgi:hypothetical protein
VVNNFLKEPVASIFRHSCPENVHARLVNTDKTTRWHNPEN